MYFFQSLTLQSVLLLLVTIAQAKEDSNHYHELLHLKPLSNGNLYAGFNFTALSPTSAYEHQHFRYLPRSLGQILQYTRTAELHARFTFGRWDAENWRSRPRSGSREGGTGVEIWAWMEGDTAKEAEKHWSDLVNSLSGLFCASMNFIDQTVTVRPTLVFEPEGVNVRTNKSLHLMHGMLPHEVVCTENLTPFLKLLPCKGKAGISSLLDGHKVFDANWQAMAIDVRPICSEGGECVTEITQTIDMILDIARSSRPRDDPIPRPPPMSEIICDNRKIYTNEDTCYPKRDDGEQAFSLRNIFGRYMQGSCELGSSDEKAHVMLETSRDRKIETDARLVSESSYANTTLRGYSLSGSSETDFSLPYQQAQPHTAHTTSSLLRVNRQMTGYGQERGGMHIVITNPHAEAKKVVYSETLPWFLRPFVHTLTTEGAEVERMYYTPAKDRQRATQLELLLNIPAHSTAVLTYDFEKAILRYTEYPPDANRGFDVPPAILRILPGEEAEFDQSEYLRTTSLLLPLPTPDFSMPYNVIILTSTVIALGFGSIFNLMTRRFVLVEEAPKSPLATILLRVRTTIKDKIARLKGANPAVTNTTDHRKEPGTGKSAAELVIEPTGEVSVMSGREKKDVDTFQRWSRGR